MSEQDEPCPIIEAACEFFIYQCDRNGEVAISHCTHKDNASEYEGNCTHARCPLHQAGEDVS